MKVASRLVCPDDEGDLKLKTSAPDGKSCLYAGDEGAQVQVSLVPVSGTPDATLDPIEGQLKALLPPPSDKPSPSKAKHAAEHDGDHDNVNITLPGLAIHAADERANIRLGPLHIDADDDKNNVHITRGDNSGKGQFTVDANDGGAIIRTISGGPDVRTTVILTSNTPGPQGWRVVGYEAHGPKTGPLVVATVKTSSDEHDHIFEDVKRLVRRSAGA